MMHVAFIVEHHYLATEMGHNLIRTIPTSEAEGVSRHRRYRNSPAYEMAQNRGKLAAGPIGAFLFVI